MKTFLKFLPCFLLSLLPWIILRAINSISMVSYSLSFLTVGDRDFYALIISFNVLSLIIGLNKVFNKKMDKEDK